MEPDDVIADIAGQALDALEDFRLLLFFSLLFFFVCVCVCVILLLFFVAFYFIGGGIGSLFFSLFFGTSVACRPVTSLFFSFFL